MTRKLYDENSFLKEFDATVLDSYPMADGYFTILDQTAFFPEGGGQASDIGLLNDIRVYDVQIKDGVIYHYTTQQLVRGEAVKGKIDWERRFDFMQQHSGEHILSGIAHSIYGCENVGFHLGKDIVTLDFDKPLNIEQLTIIEDKANEKIFENVAFKCYYPDNTALQSLNYRSKKEITEDIRIVEIENTDLCACCAPHVNFSGQIGIIKLLAHESLRGGIRIEIKCGKRALEDYKIKYENIHKISSMLCAKQEETADATDRLFAENKGLRYEISLLKKRIIEEKVNDFVLEKNKTAIFEDGLDIKELQLFSDALYKKNGGIIGVFSNTDNGYSFAICGEEGSLNEFFADFKNAHSVRGGGRNGMVQGTVAAKREEIEKLFYD